jgi:hypothetical protein
LGQLAQTIGTEFLDISSGEILQHPAPEPGSLPLLGAGLIGLAIVMRRYTQKSDPKSQLLEAALDDGRAALSRR